MLIARENDKTLGKEGAYTANSAYSRMNGSAAQSSASNQKF